MGKSSQRAVWFLAGFLLVSGWILPSSTIIRAQQGGTVRYVYDNNGRLRAVISPNGEAAIYEYDPAGNITAIRRNTADTLEVLGFSPSEGVPGTQVTITGTGFGAGVNSVAFNGTAAQIVSVNGPVVIAIVLDGAATGPIAVTTPQGSTTTSQDFIVKGIKLTPTSVNLDYAQKVQYTALVFPATADQSVTWSVNETVGGNTTFGTISATGLFTPPTILYSTPDTVTTIRATSLADPSLFADAEVTFGAINMSTTISAIALGVLLIRESAPQPPEVTTISAISRGITTKTGPYIAAISPNQISPGSNLVVTITGANLTGVDTIRFSNTSGGVDANITASNISVNGAGTSLTATISVGPAAVPGTRLVVLSTPSGNSLVFNNGLNTIEIIP